MAGSLESTGDRFNSEAFYAALNAARLSRQLTWKEVATEAGVNPSTLSRMGQGKRPDVNGLAALLSWSGLSLDDFTKHGSSNRNADAIARITALLRADPNLSDSNAKVIEDIVTATYKRLKGR